MLWILPYVLSGWLCGYAAKKSGFALKQEPGMLLVVVCELIVTLINTGVMYLDARIYGTIFPGFITGSLAIRLVICVVKAVVLARSCRFCSRQ